MAPRSSAAEWVISMSIEKLSAVSAELAAAKKKLQDFAAQQGKEAIGAAFKECFGGSSILSKIVWSQYTPYFNDGEACVFRVNDPSLYSVGGSEEYGDDDLYGLVRDTEWTRGRRNELNNKYGKDTIDHLLAVWSQLDEDILEAVFGDHVEITITKDKVSVGDYSHD